MFKLKESAADWIRRKVKEKGRVWVASHFEDYLLQASHPVSSESYNRLIRLAVQELREKESPETDYDAAQDGNILRSSDISTVEGLVDYARVNLTDFQIKKAKVNTWGSADNPSKQVTIELSPRFNPKAILDDFKKDMENYVPPKLHLSRPHNVEDCLYEVSVPDVHYGLLAWKPETGGADYDIEIAGKIYLETVSHLLNHIPKGVKRILFPVGSDFFNSDTLQNTTTAGTPQDEDTRWQKTFQKGCYLVRDAIALCAQKAEVVEVPVVSGNHDHTKAFYMGVVLEAAFGNEKNIIIDNSPNMYKYYKYGKCLIGITHGHGAKQDKLPHLMAVDQPQLWAETIHREWHIGHLHMASTKGFQMESESPGVKVVVVPSIAPASAWISRSGYRSVREAVGFLWHPENGRIATYSYRPS